MDKNKEERIKKTVRNLQKLDESSLILMEHGSKLLLAKQKLDKKEAAENESEDLQEVIF